MEEVERLRAAIRSHRDARGDDRCWMDDEELYRVLPEGYTAPPRDTAVELEHCRRFIASRQNPATVYVSPEREIERLRAALDARPPQAPQEWRPIETHDGTPMPVLIAEQGGYVVEAWFSDERQTWWELNSCDDGSPGSDRRVCPTHWMPLPDPPAADARRPGQETPD